MTTAFQAVLSLPENIIGRPDKLEKNEKFKRFAAIFFNEGLKFDYLRDIKMQEEVDAAMKIAFGDEKAFRLVEPRKSGREAHENRRNKGKQAGRRDQGQNGGRGGKSKKPRKLLFIALRVQNEDAGQTVKSALKTAVGALTHQFSGKEAKNVNFFLITSRKSTKEFLAKASKP